MGDGPVERAQALHRGEHRLRRVGDARQDDADLLVAQRGDAVLGPQRGAQALDDERQGDGGRRPLQQRLQAVDAPQLHQEHGQPAVGRLGDGRLPVQEAQQVLARAFARGVGVEAVVGGRGRGAHER